MPDCVALFIFPGFPEEHLVTNLKCTLSKNVFDGRAFIILCIYSLDAAIHFSSKYMLREPLQRAHTKSFLIFILKGTYYTYTSEYILGLSLYTPPSRLDFSIQKRLWKHFPVLLNKKFAFT